MVDVAALLGSTFPDLDVATVEQLGEGWDHVAYLVNGDLVFRLPWEIVEGTGPAPGAAAEIALLRAVAGRLPLAVPSPQWVAPDDAWFGYPYLAGSPVQGGPLPDGFAALVTETIVAIEGAPGVGLPARRQPTDDDALVASLVGRGVVPATIDAAVQNAMATRAERWPAAVARRCVVLHADLGLDHWLVDDTGRVVALIDWSDAVVGPPETQLRTLLWDEPALARDVIGRYEDATGIAVDRELVVADGLIQAYTDLAELTAEGDDDTERCHWFLEHWSEVGIGALQ